MRVKLVRLGREYKEQFFDMMREWKTYNDEHPEANHSPWALFRNDYTDFDHYLDDLEITKEENGYSPHTTFFALDTDRNIFVGAANIRLKLTQRCIIDGGHIGDGIRPSERGKGYGTQIVRLALEECRKLGIRKALMVCDATNTASKKTIINNGGVFESEITVPETSEKELRFWFDLGEETIETERLTLRRMLPLDYKEAAIWFTDEKCATYLLSKPFKKPEECIPFLQLNDPNSSTRFIMIMHRNDDHMPIGVMSCSLDPSNNEWEISYNIRSDQWGKGYATEGARGLIDHINKNYGGHVFIGECANENVGSGKVLQKLGMKFYKASSYTKKDGSRTFESGIYRMEI